jgi:hypothetical protein
MFHGACKTYCSTSGIGLKVCMHVRQALAIHVYIFKQHLAELHQILKMNSRNHSSSSSQSHLDQELNEKAGGMCKVK